MMCVKSYSLKIKGTIPRCNCPGDTLGPERPRIQGYTDNMLNPAMLPAACTPDAMAPGALWDGTFPGFLPGFCNWTSDPAQVTINVNRRFGGAQVFDTGAGFWALQVSGLQGLFTTVLWYGESPMGTGGACTSPDGLVFTAVAPFPIFCGCAPLVTIPATLTIEVA